MFNNMKDQFEELHEYALDLVKRLKERYKYSNDQDISCIKINGNSPSISFYQNQMYAYICIQAKGMLVDIWEGKKTMHSTGHMNHISETEMFNILDCYFQRNDVEQMTLF